MAWYDETRNERVRLLTAVESLAGSDVVVGYLDPIRTPGQNETDRARLIEYSPDRNEFRIFPIDARELDRLEPKYSKIETITLEDYWDYRQDVTHVDLVDMLDYLPSGMTKDVEYGLGFAKECLPLVQLIEERTSCNQIVLTTGDEAIVDGSVFKLGRQRFDEIVKEFRRIRSRGDNGIARVRRAYVHNNLAGELGLELVNYSLGRHPISRLITEAAANVKVLDESERDALITAVRSESSSLAKTDPEQFVALRRDIELVSLENLIEKFETELSKNKDEPFWQQFFELNAFALQQVFGVPMISVQAGASTGGEKFDGTGSKLTDFLYKNSLTNNVALVEIKKPTTPLLGKSTYRGGVFGPSKDLTGSVTQVLDQAYQLSKSLTGLKDSSHRWDLESFAIGCFVVAGRTPTDPDKTKSLELYRANSRSVSIFTYDEVLERLRLLHMFLSRDPQNGEPGRPN